MLTKQKGTKKGTTVKKESAKIQGISYTTKRLPSQKGTF